MGASLAIVAVANAAPVLLGRNGVVLTPVQLPASYGSPLADEWGSIAFTPARGDAVTGRFAAAEVDSTPSTVTANAGRALAGQYISFWALAPANGCFVDYYA